MRIILILAILSLLSCDRDHKTSFDNFNETELDSLGERYNNLSNMFFQPTEIHRRYKDSAMMVRPKNVEYRQVGSYSYKKKGEHIKAMELLDQAVADDLATGSADALEYLAWTQLYFYRDYESAIKTVNTIDSITGTDYNVCWGEPCGFIKGQAHYQLQEYDLANQAFNQVNLEEGSRGFDTLANHLLHFYRARSFHKKGDATQAEKYYKIVLDADDSFSEALFFIAQLHREEGRLDLAKKHLDEASYWIKKGKKMSEPYIERFDELFEYMVEEEVRALASKIATSK